MRKAPDANGFFVGDYEGLSALGTTVHPFWSQSDRSLELPGLMVSSDNDPCCAPQVAEQLAADWGVPRIGVGRLGHINSSSGIGRWDLGRALLTAFTAGLRGSQHRVEAQI